ncbi:hypothetical protein TRICHSKD4_2059 [Roseibium sp. TrichSKD4]|nr:hypothetical protein TRICHSKD4_2059 [Roseibium sp. TrichSKD4]
MTKTVIDLFDRTGANKMAATHSVSLFEVFSNAAVSFGHSLHRIIEDYGRARAASALYEELSALNDEQLAEMGLERDHIARTVYQRVFDA